MWICVLHPVHTVQLPKIYDLTDKKIFHKN